MELKIQIDNYFFSYYAEGASHNPPILFLHGFMGDRFEFTQTMSVLSKRYYCVAIDLLGHGNTEVIDRQKDRDDNYTIQSTANFVIKFLDLLRIDRCFLVGYSMGGRVALYLALHFPKYFSRVVLESASAGLSAIAERSDRLDRDRQLATKLETDDFKAFLEKWYQQPIFAHLRSHPNFERMLEQRLHNSPTQLAKSLRNLSTGMQPSLWEKLPTNQIPLLLLVGELDAKFVQIARQMTQSTKLAQLEVIASCGHNIHWEFPQLFAEKVQIFLNNVSSE
ncbi:2-succinyl-6-hydroxy-2,4-cyclohexadiene-1-carboxylate synthase [Pseudanabaena sp. UWO310]|uniref:2-succinyl-6-hydroxy-2, 4-cyclohexadiene-1-carboxylate synthase n=1 Tax=Pseudanabaena sp. UWO310 TaxID=2480795 RepID=UPI001157D866|nr:2-succinyl-6-hydroxy-2,4-cyclohexadiene-1-carboxylate synthase [Pseudanabaena sp. UWO310]TYQ30608.1 2-succinyl-6-hydroxy-2,4-cyclohexadiene-1-carboxylate synthase [Pseudanabaena sp. UWO310]